MNKFLVFLIIAQLACGVSSQIPPEVSVTDTVLTPESTDVMIVTAETLHIRNAPDGVVVKEYLSRGDEVTVYQREVKNGWEWCQIRLMPKRWVACWWLR